MKHASPLSTLLVALLAAIPLSADEPATSWQEVCSIAQDRELTLTTQPGETVQGYCVAIDVHNISVRTSDNKIVRIARTTLEKLEVERRKGHQLEALCRGMHKGIHWGFEDGLSPRGPLPLAAVPLTLAWGAAVAPFCILGDIISDAAGKREIKVAP
jgi:hypothetical protein